LDARNFFGRIEVIFPIEDGLIQERVRHEILEKSWQDNVKTRELLPNGKYQRIAKNKADPEIRSQWEFMRLSGTQNGKQTTRSKSKYPHVEVAQRPPVVPPPSVAEQDQGHTI
jgi:polyphosphate kinase